MSDATLRTCERLAAQGDELAARRVAADAVRRGELPVGCVVHLDASRVPAKGWVSYSWGRAESVDCPKKITGSWEVTHNHQREGFRLITLRRLSRRGVRLGTRAENVEAIREEHLRLALTGVEVPGRSTIPAPRKQESAPEGAPWVRRFSALGPCIPEGQLVRETARFYVLDATRGGICKSARVAKGGYHLEPCQRCTDHPQTHYPNGYQD